MSLHLVILKIKSLFSLHIWILSLILLAQGNIQRCSHYMDQINDVKSSLERFIEERRPRAVDIISRHQSKRAMKKKERLWHSDGEDYCKALYLWLSVVSVCYVQSGKTGFVLWPFNTASYPLTSSWPHLRCDVGLEEGEYK